MLALPLYYWKEELRKNENPKIIELNIEDNNNKQNDINDQNLSFSVFFGNESIKIPAKTEIKNCKLNFYSKGNSIAEIKFKDILLNIGEKFILKNVFNIKIKDFTIKDLLDLDYKIDYDLIIYPSFFGYSFYFGYNIKYLLNFLLWLNKRIGYKVFVMDLTEQNGNEKNLIEDLKNNLLFDYKEEYFKIGLKRKYFIESEIFNNKFLLNLGIIRINFEGLYGNNIILKGFKSKNNDKENNCIKNDDGYYFLFIKIEQNDFKRFFDAINNNFINKIEIRNIEFYSYRNKNSKNNTLSIDQDIKMPYRIININKEIFILDNFYNIFENKRLSNTSELIINDLIFENKNLSFSFDAEKKIFNNKIFEYILLGNPSIEMKINNFFQKICIKLKLEKNILKTNIKVEISDFFVIPFFPLEVSLDISSFEIYNYYYNIEKNVKLSFQNNNENFSIFLKNINNESKLLFETSIKTKINFSQNNIKQILSFKHKIALGKNYEFYNINSEIDFYIFNKLLNPEMNLKDIINKSDSMTTNLNNSVIITLNNFNIEMKCAINCENFYVNLKGEKFSYDFNNDLFYGKNFLKTIISTTNYKSIISKKELEFKIKLHNDYIFYRYLLNPINDFEIKNNFEMMPLNFDFDLYETDNSIPVIKILFKNEKSYNIQNLEKNILFNNYKNNDEKFFFYHDFEIDELEYFISKKKKTCLLNTSKISLCLVQNKNMKYFGVDNFELYCKLIDYNNLKTLNISKYQDLFIFLSIIKKFIREKDKNFETYNSKKNLIDCKLDMGITNNDFQTRYLSCKLKFEKKFIQKFRNLFINLNNFIRIYNQENNFELKFGFEEKKDDIFMYLNVFWDPLVEKYENMNVQIQTKFSTLNTNINFASIFKYFIEFFYNVNETKGKEEKADKKTVSFEIKNLYEINNFYKLCLIIRSKNFEKKLNSLLAEYLCLLISNDYMINFNLKIKIINLINLKLGRRNLDFIEFNLESIIFDYKTKMYKQNNIKKKGKKIKCKSESYLELNSRATAPSIFDQDIFDVLEYKENTIFLKFIYDKLKLCYSNCNENYKCKFNWREYFSKYLYLYSCSEMIFIKLPLPFYFKSVGTPIEFIITNEENLLFYFNTRSLIYDRSPNKSYFDQFLLIKFLFQKINSDFKSNLKEKIKSNLKSHLMKNNTDKSNFYLIIRYENFIRVLNFYLDKDYDISETLTQVIKVFNSKYGPKKINMTSSEIEDKYFFNYIYMDQILKRFGFKFVNLVDVYDIKHKSYVKKNETLISNQFDILYYYIEQRNL